MPDISLRLDKDMLVLSASMDATVHQLGIKTQRDFDVALLVEPEIFENFFRLESIAGTQCIIAPTANLTPARLAHSRMEANGVDLAQKALALAHTFIPQHLLVEIGPCELPLDPSSRQSLKENRDQYERAAHLFDGMQFDAFFLNGFSDINDLKCALTGLAKASSAPVFASVDVTHDGTLASGRGTLEEACQTIQDLEGAAAGFTTYADQETAWKLASRAAQATALPLMVSLGVGSRDQNQMQPTAENPYFNADTMIPAAELLQETGVQFLRAVGDATPSYSSALVAAIAGMDVVQTEQKQKQAQKKTQQDLAAFIAEARAKVSKAIQSPEHPMTMGDSAEGAGSSDTIEDAMNPEREKGSADKGLSASTQDIKDLTE